MPIDAFATLAELADALARETVGSGELTDHYLARIRLANRALNAFVQVDEDLARRHARAADERRASGLRLGPLDGVPVALKDLLEVEGFRTGVGSALWKERRSGATAAVVRNLLAAGMVPLGKTQMVEFAFGTWGANPHLGTPWNPWDLDVHRVPGGSSSGSGVAVAAGLAPAALGSDTGGSVRIPSALNGITGLKTSGGLMDTALPADIVAVATRDRDTSALAEWAAADLFHRPHAQKWDPRPWQLAFLDSRRDRVRFHARTLIYEWFLKWPWDEWLGRRRSTGAPPAA
jgi:Asp-tRNA(Asn)/Glu-tRNA(Gln) amidotransferase A subunit family amidase